MTAVEMEPPSARIMRTATRLFYGNGIQATGIGELVDEAGVSKRTLYQLFGSKDDLVAEYLRQVSARGVPGEHFLDRTDLSPRDRLLGLFTRPTTIEHRGCPLHNAAVELPVDDHPARQVIVDHKLAVLAKVVAVAAEAGVREPEPLGRQLITLYEGATALSTSLRDYEPFDSARSAAEVLIDVATGPAGAP
ncbi:TetR/AcrR family transcriptional regulator [Kutzneria kofuensis]|uniref:AcrR family transcriptional regulator n=1 Tax=Kutzneria kofuensis TaxID=103725 RepID=A0A7W9KCJ5_9PSEU|nr:TetR/AcrR family transcriptional regulator [Kutzneria kofuensis]MBB5890113.1 AcrR family transcriptional regulator [Kutzneria kofuensis]